jgi:hypothetical protein
MTTVAKDIDQAILIYADESATRAAKRALTTMMLKHGEDMFACGFAWVTYPEKIRSNSQFGKALTAIGFRFDDYRKRFVKWNPGDYNGQSIDFKEEAAKAYADEFEASTGIKLTVGSRMD